MIYYKIYQVSNFTKAITAARNLSAHLTFLHFHLVIESFTFWRTSFPETFKPTVSMLETEMSRTASLYWLGHALYFSGRLEFGRFPLILVEPSWSFLLLPFLYAATQPVRLEYLKQWSWKSHLRWLSDEVQFPLKITCMQFHILTACLFHLEGKLESVYSFSRNVTNIHFSTDRLINTPENVPRMQAHICTSVQTVSQADTQCFSYIYTSVPA